MAKRYALGVPHGIVMAVVPPCGVGQDMRNAFNAIEFHYVDFTARRPFHVLSQQPDGRPRATGRGYLGPHFEASVEETETASGGHRGGGVLDILTLAAPVVGIFLIKGILALVASSLDDKVSVFATCVLALVPLSLVVTYEAAFWLPYGGVGRSIGVEFVAPDESPLALGVCGQSADGE